ncbi:MAG: hypothetical protein JJV89_03950, partial [Desulfosarcina sp.]|nr:hypothetical protein [Desulfobacterales bacterium]
MNKKILFSISSCFILIFFTGTASAINVKIHGNMLQTIGSTNFASTLQGKLKSGKTDFFSYDNMLNIEGYDKGYDFLDDKENVSTF